MGAKKGVSRLANTCEAAIVSPRLVMPPAREHIVDAAQQCQVEAWVPRAAAVAGQILWYEKAKASAGPPPAQQPRRHHCGRRCGQAQ